MTRKARNVERSGRVTILVQGAASTGRDLHTETQKALSLPYGDVWL